MRDRISKKKLNTELYKKVYRIRGAEQAIIKYYDEDEMKTPMHMSMGEEAISAGVCMALGKRHQAFGYYRSHALYISKTDETKKFFAEMYGKTTGAVKGIGGSMHLIAPDAGLIGFSAVVASTIAPAVGAAFVNKITKNGKIVAVFFGDGAIEEGVFWESLNFACLKRLPVIFVCEDNGLAVDVTKRERQGFRSIPEIVKNFYCNLLTSETTDPEKIYELTLRAIKLVQTANRPCFLHLKYYRFLQHIGIKNDFDTSGPSPRGGFERTDYRSRAEYNKWLEKDPVKVQRTKLCQTGIKEAEIIKLEKRIDREIEASITQAKKAPFPVPEALYNYVYSEN